MANSEQIDLEHLSRLARIELSEAEKATYSGQLQAILGFFGELQQVDVAGIEPMAHPFDVSGPLRPDEPAQPWAPARALSNAPQAREDQVVVPKVVEDA